MSFVDVGIEKSFGESSKAISSFEDEMLIKLVKMAKEANGNFWAYSFDLSLVVMINNIW